MTDAPPDGVRLDKARRPDDGPPPDETPVTQTRADRFREALRAASGGGVPPKDGGDEPSGTLLSEAVGGVRGMIDSGLPAIVFVAANAIGGLRAGVIAALVVGFVIVVLRLIRKEPQQQAWSGFVGVAIAAFIAARLHHASGFFLPGIVKNALYGVLAAVSIVARRPAAGYAFAAFDRRYAHWKTDPPLRRAAMWATGIWVVVFAVRFVVQGVLYLADKTGWLAAANIAMGWPMFALAVAGSIALLRRAIPEDQGDQSPGDASETTADGSPSNPAS